MEMMDDESPILTTSRNSAHWNDNMSTQYKSKWLPVTKAPNVSLKHECGRRIDEE